MNEAHLELMAFQNALKEYVLTVDDAYGKQFEEFSVGFEGRSVRHNLWCRAVWSVAAASSVQLWLQARDSSLTVGSAAGLPRLCGRHRNKM